MCDHKWTRYRINGISVDNKPIEDVEPMINLSVCSECNKICFDRLMYVRED